MAGVFAKQLEAGSAIFAHVFSSWLVLPSQFAGPVSDIVASGWLPSSGADLYAMLDEPSPDDDDYIYSPPNPTTEIAEVRLAALIDPMVDTGHTLRYRLAARGQNAVFDVSLVQGASIVATWRESVAAGDAITFERTLTSPQASSITDYADLRFRVVAHG